MPFVVKSSASVPDGVIQIKDLWPDKTHANAVIDPKPYGYRYINSPQNTTLTNAIVGNFAFLQECSGLAAYLITNLAKNNGDAASCPQANALASLIVQQAQNGADMTNGNLNWIDDNLNGNVFDGFQDSHRLAILAILGGATYTVPAGYVYKDSGNDNIIVPQVDFFTSNEARLFDSSFYISNARGDISVLKSNSCVYLDTTVNPPVSTTGPLVRVYNDDGTVNE